MGGGGGVPFIPRHEELIIQHFLRTVYTVYIRNRTFGSGRGFFFFFFGGGGGGGGEGSGSVTLTEGPLVFKVGRPSRDKSGDT